MTLELFEQGPSVYIPFLLISILITAAFYSAFPLLFAVLRKKIITSRRYRFFCYLLNFLVLLFFIALNGSSSGAPYILWTSVFSHFGLKALDHRGLIVDPNVPVVSSEKANIQYIEQHKHNSISKLSSVTHKKQFFNHFTQNVQKSNSFEKLYIHKTAVKVCPSIIIITVAAIIVASFCILRTIQCKNQITLLNTQIADMRTKLELLETELKSANESAEQFKNLHGEDHLKNYDLTKEIELMKPIYDYCEENMVFVITKTQQYHKGHCFMIQDSSSSFEGYTVASAQQRGYLPCWLCCNEHY